MPLNTGSQPCPQKIVSLSCQHPALHPCLAEACSKVSFVSSFAMQVRQAGSGQPQVPALEGLGTPRMALQDGQGQVGLCSCSNRAWVAACPRA